MSARDPFARLVSDAMTRRDLGLRELCREVELDPSFFSKVLVGKRSAPSEENVLRKIASALGIDPIELIVSAGRIPTEWTALRTDPNLIRAVSSIASGARASYPQTPVSSRAAPAKTAVAIRPSQHLSEELL